MDTSVLLAHLLAEDKVPPGKMWSQTLVSSRLLEYETWNRIHALDLEKSHEYDYHRDWLTIVPSAQAASRGFLGASLYGEAGRRFFGIVGMGRTNLQPYWNLGFDPNDYVQFGTGYRDAAGNRVSVYAIRDNRLGTGQNNTHVFFRRYLPHDWRLTADLVREHGNGDHGLVVRAWAISTDVDWRRWFVRLARDPHVNYTLDRQLRVSTGLRF